MKSSINNLVLATLAVCALVLSSCTMNDEEAQAQPGYSFDPTWPKDLPNSWKIGGITGLAVDSNDNIWAYNRPNNRTCRSSNA